MVDRAVEGHTPIQSRPVSSFTLGRIYFYGVKGKIERDESKAARYLLRASNNGCGRASYMLFEFCKRGWCGFSVDCELFNEFRKRAIRFLPLEAREGKLHAAFYLGRLFLHGLMDSDVGPEFSKAVYWFEREASRGHLEAATHLANCYARGLGVPRDLLKALKCFKALNEKNAQLAKVERNRMLQQFTVEERKQVFGMAIFEKLLEEARNSTRKQPSRLSSCTGTGDR